MLRTLLVATAICAALTVPALAFDNWVSTADQRAAMEKMTPEVREAFTHFMSLPNEKVAELSFLLGLTPDLPCHWVGADGRTSDFGADEKTTESIPGCLQRRFDRYERLKAKGWPDDQAALLTANSEKSEQNLKTWREPRASGSSLCPKPHRMTEDGCQ